MATPTSQFERPRRKSQAQSAAASGSGNCNSDCCNCDPKHLAGRSRVRFPGGMVALLVDAQPDPKAGNQPLLIVLLGPTASGKTALSLEMAERFGGEIVSCDSVAVYRDLEIGTAKPTFAERERVPHHMIDVVSPVEPYTAGNYSRSARTALQDISARGCVPIVTGGTGLYLRALIDGLFVGPERSEPLRDRLRGLTTKARSGRFASCFAPLRSGIRCAHPPQ